MVAAFENAAICPNSDILGRELLVSEIVICVAQNRANCPQLAHECEFRRTQERIQLFTMHMRM